uniref:primase alpha helix C-terminal domain-containing protein n=1 Tax=uncultured Secundilactobacillus sp. TaxID=2813935 RepID=UPI00258ACC4F
VQQNIGWLPGIDIKAHPNNYVVVAPSEGYEWLNREPMVTASTQLLTAINQQTHTMSTANLPVSDEKTNTSRLFETIVDGLGDTGGRNNALTSFIGGLLYRNVDADKAYLLAKLANTNTPDSLPQNEFDRTFESMLKKEIRRREEAKNDA